MKRKENGTGSGRAQRKPIPETGTPEEIVTFVRLPQNLPLPSLSLVLLPCERIFHTLLPWAPKLQPGLEKRARFSHHVGIVKF